MDEEYRDAIRQCHLIIGVSKRQPIKCAVCAYEEDVIVSFTSVYEDTKVQDRFFKILRDNGIPVEVESNGVAEQEVDKGMYPEVSYDVDKWKKMTNLFYAVLIAVAACLGVVNYLTYTGSMWSVIAIACMAYVGMTVRYSIMRHANLGSKMLIQILLSLIHI